MGAYEKINDFNARAIRKLSDYHIFTQGRQTECTRLTKTSDIWGNSDSETISVSTIHAVFTFPPGEMPLIRIRAGGGTKEAAQATGLFFYDVLPIEIYTRWEDELEVGDVLYFYATDEKGNRIPVVFKILDQKGSFSSQLIWRKMVAAPITDIDREIPSDLRERLLAEVGA